MKKWETPVLEVLDINMTFNGPGKAVPDCFDVGDSNGHNHGVGQDPGLSNASCLKPTGGGLDS